MVGRPTPRFDRERSDRDPRDDGAYLFPERRAASRGPQSLCDELLTLEHESWQARASDRDARRAFYRTLLADNVLLLLPGGVVIDDRTEALARLSGEAWDWFLLSDERVVLLNQSSAVVAYGASTWRRGQRYTALVNSTYSRDEQGWKLVIRQQTPG
jgi:hypothetical protein